MHRRADFEPAFRSTYQFPRCGPSCLLVPPCRIRRGYGFAAAFDDVVAKTNQYNYDNQPEGPLSTPPCAEYGINWLISRTSSGSSAYILERSRCRTDVLRAWHREWSRPSPSDWTRARKPGRETRRRSAANCRGIFSGLLERPARHQPRSSVGIATAWPDLAARRGLGPAGGQALLALAELDVLIDAFLGQFETGAAMGRDSGRGRLAPQTRTGANVATLLLRRRLLSPPIGSRISAAISGSSSLRSASLWSARAGLLLACPHVARAHRRGGIRLMPQTVRVLTHRHSTPPSVPGPHRPHNRQLTSSYWNRNQTAHGRGRCRARPRFRRRPSRSRG